MKSLTRQELETVLYELAVFGIYGSFADFRTVVAFVIEERMSDPVEVHAYLVGSSCLETTFTYPNLSSTR